MTGKRVFRKNHEHEEKPTKLEYEVADYIRKHVEHKRTRFMYHPVEYFTGYRAVDALLESPWSQRKVEGGEKPSATACLFTSRQAVCVFLDSMLRHKLFHRAKKIVVSDRDLRRNQLKKLRKKEEMESRGKGTGAEEESCSDEAERTCDDCADTKNKPLKKKRVRLDMHLEQKFCDTSDAYVWIYTPTPHYYYLLGFCLLCAIVALCLFPLWPTCLRDCVYYLSLAVGLFLLLILALAVVKLFIFAFIWCVSLGKCHFWLLPNLTEDVGFFASFWPLYKYNSSGKGKSSRKRKTHNSRDEEHTDTQHSAPVDDAIAEMGAHNVVCNSSQQSPSVAPSGGECVATGDRLDICTEGSDGPVGRDGGEEGSGGEGREETASSDECDVIDEETLEGALPCAPVSHVGDSTCRRRHVAAEVPGHAATREDDSSICDRLDSSRADTPPSSPSSSDDSQLSFEVISEKTD